MSCQHSVNGHKEYSPQARIDVGTTTDDTHLVFVCAEDPLRSERATIIHLTPKTARKLAKALKKASWSV